MKKNLIKRNDYNRVLITETLPFETPIIFSNDGLYEQVSSLEQASDVQKRSSGLWCSGRAKPSLFIQQYLTCIR